MQKNNLAFTALLLIAVSVSLCIYPTPALVASAQSDTPADETILSPYWPPEVRRWESIIVQYATDRRVDPDFIAAVIWKESKGNPEARSIVGAVGLMQLMPTTWRPSPEKLKEPATNLQWGVRALAHTIRDGDGDLYYSLAAYNGGWSQIHLRVTRRYATEVLDCYARAIATKYGLTEDEHWLATFTTEGMSGHRTITVLGPHRPLARYSERPGIQSQSFIGPTGTLSHATVITFEDEWGSSIRVETWLVTEEGLPITSP